MKIKLPCGRILQIDKQDAARFVNLPLFSSKGTSTFYAKTVIDGKRQYVHRVIMAPGAGMVVDHRNGDGLDNRRRNLRVVSQSQNLQAQRACRSGRRFVGVYPHKGRFTARLGYNGSLLYLGIHATEELAAAAYDRKAKELYGKAAKLNLQ